jgi:hypothetical protein
MYIGPMAILIIEWGEPATKHTIEIDGDQRDIEIMAMDESFIVYRKMYMLHSLPRTSARLHPMTMFHNWNASGERFG